MFLIGVSIAVSTYINIIEIYIMYKILRIHSDERNIQNDRLENHEKD
jgi:hypothetical protein